MRCTSSKRCQKVTYAGFEELVEQSLDHTSFKFDSARVLAQFDQVMTELEVMPFDEMQLLLEKDGALS